MFRTTTKLRNWFSLGVDRAPYLFSATAVLICTLSYIIIWLWLIYSKLGPVNISFLVYLLEVNLIVFLFLIFKHFLIQWGISETGIKKDEWIIDQYGNGITESVSKSGEPYICLLINGWLEAHKKESIQIKDPTSGFFPAPYRKMLVVNPNGNRRFIKIRCDDDLLDEALKEKIDPFVSQKDTASQAQNNSIPTQVDKPSKSYSHNNPDTDATTSERPEGSCSSTSQRELPERSNEMEPSGTKQEPENSQAQNCCSNPSTFNGTEKERTSRSDRPDTSTDETNDYKSKPTNNDNNQTDREQTNPDSFDPSKQFPNAELDKLGNLVVTLLLDKGAEEVKINSETKRSNRNDNKFFVMVLKDVIRELSSKHDITLSNYIFAKILKETFYSDFKKLDSIERYVDRAKHELKSNKQKVNDS